MRIAPLVPLALVLTPALALLQEDEAEQAPPRATVGEPAPAFRLNDQAGKTVAVGGEGDAWTVVAFYPKAMTPG